MGIFRRSAAPAADTPAPRAATAAPPRGESAALDALPTAFACVSLIVHTATQARPVTERAGMPTESPAWIRHPEELSGYTMRDLIGSTTQHLASRGRAGWWASPVGDMSWALAPVHPERLSVTFAADYSRIWHMDGAPAQIADGPGRRAGLVPFGYVFLPRQAEPVGPLQASRVIASGFVDTETYASNVFGTGAGTGPRMEAEADIPEETATRWRDYWAEQHNDPTDPRMPVLGAGLRIATDLIDPATAAWIEARQYNAGEIARLFRVPASRLDLPTGSSLVYATARDNDAAFMRYTISAYTDPVAEALTGLLPNGVNATEDESVSMSWESLLSPTPTDLIDYLAAAVGAGLMTREEARGALRLPTLPAAPPDPASVTA